MNFFFFCFIKSIKNIEFSNREYIRKDGRLRVGNCTAATCFSQEKSDWKTRTLEYQVVIAIIAISQDFQRYSYNASMNSTMIVNCLQLRLIFLHPWTKGIQSQRKINSAMGKDG